MERLATDLVVLTPEDSYMIGERDFGVPGLVAREVIGPFVRVQALGPLIMVHDGVFEPRHGIGHHPHRFNERLFYILEGAVDHDDALNDITGHMDTGDTGRLTEGVRGMLHKEWNNTDGRARAFILVYETDPTPPRASFELLADADAGRYTEGEGVETKELVGPKVSFPVNGDLRFFADSRMAPEAVTSLEVGSEASGFVFILEGEVDADGMTLAKNHSLLVPPGEARSIPLRARADARIVRVVAGPGRGLIVR
jgi:redox-sensitive bicupin YhaK (pirin superfamily)